jgi:hypothetical protein
MNYVGVLVKSLEVFHMKRIVSIEVLIQSTTNINFGTIMDDFNAVWNMFNYHIEFLSNNQIKVVKFKSHQIH